MIDFKVKVWKYVSNKACGDLKTKYKDNRKDYYKVIVFDDYKSMYEYADKHFKEYAPDGHDYSGLCHYSGLQYFYDEECTQFAKNSRICGYILLHKDYLGGGTVSHECTHAINYYFRYRIEDKNKIFEETEYDELFAYMLGSLVNQIYGKLYDEKIL